MTEERLIEITSEILKNDGPLGRMAYISTLKESEALILRDYISNPAYEGLNVYQKVLKFAQDYLESKNISLMDLVQDKSNENNGQNNENIEEQQTMISYVEKMLSTDEDMESVYRGRR